MSMSQISFGSTFFASSDFQTVIPNKEEHHIFPYYHATSGNMSDEEWELPVVRNAMASSWFGMSSGKYNGHTSCNGTFTPYPSTAVTYGAS